MSEPLKLLIDQVKDAYVRAEQVAVDKAQKYYSKVGSYLAKCKKAKPKNITWSDFCEQNFSFGHQRADELIRIAEKRTTVDEVREKKKNSMRTVRAKRAPRGDHSSTEDKQDQDDTEDDNPANHRTAFLLRVDHCKQLAVHSGPVTEELVMAARQVAMIWNKLADKMESEHG